MKSQLRIQLTGGSGIGKTTLAKWLATNYGIPFVSGSYSDLVPSTRKEKHTLMIQKEAKKVFEQDIQLINARNKSLQGENNYATDRSYVDSIAYAINKLSHRLPQCDIEHIEGICNTLLDQQTTHLIFLPFDKEHMDKWEMENNNKRITNVYYQFQVTQIIYGILKNMGYRKDKFLSWSVGQEVGYIRPRPDSVELPVLTLREMDFEKRKKYTKKFLQVL